MKHYAPNMLAPNNNLQMIPDLQRTITLEKIYGICSNAIHFYQLTNFQTPSSNSFETRSANRGWWAEYLINYWKYSVNFFQCYGSLQIGHCKLVSKISWKPFETWSADRGTWLIFLTNSVNPSAGDDFNISASSPSVGSPWTQWTFTMDSVDSLDNVHGYPGQSPVSPWTVQWDQPDWTMSMDSVDIVNGLSGHCPWTQRTVWTLSMDTLDKVQGVQATEQCSWTMSTESMDWLDIVHGLTGHSPVWFG